jgi:thiamine-monophosphate kinase
VSASGRHLPLGAGREFDAIRTMLARWGSLAAEVGGDCAILDPPAAGERLVVSTDTSVEGVHFRRGWVTAADVGYRATMAALSDLAAAGARPIGVLVALTVPGAWRGELSSLADGIGDAVRRAGTIIVGGDTTSGDALSVTVTVLGEARAPLTRRGARVGDRVYVTGVLGGPSMAVREWSAGRSPGPASRARFARPTARIAEGRWLAEHGAVAAVDISDGLAADLGHVAAASGVRIRIDLARVPRVAGAELRDIVAGGEEYELAVIAPVLDVADFARTFAAGEEGGDVTLTEIGVVQAADAREGGVDVVGVDVVGVDVVDGAGGAVRVDLTGGYDHFSD